MLGDTIYSWSDIIEPRNNKIQIFLIEKIVNIKRVKFSRYELKPNFAS
jgi:hypothetical protein